MMIANLVRGDGTRKEEVRCDNRMETVGTLHSLHMTGIRLWECEYPNEKLRDKHVQRTDGQCCQQNNKFKRNKYVQTHALHYSVTTFEYSGKGF